MNPLNMGHMLTPGPESISSENGLDFIWVDINMESLMVAIF